MKRVTCGLLVALFWILAGNQLWAWGCSGHEVVALIALHSLQELDVANHTQVAQQVETLLAAQSRGYSGRYCSDPGLDAIAYFATWADDNRVVDPTTGNWHFWDIPLSVSSAKLGEYCDGGCVVQALPNEIEILGDKTKDSSTRSTALLYVIHLVGDMHQPLHAEDNNDRGGNCVPVSFLGKPPMPASGAGNYSANLHGVWDTEIVENLGKISRHSSDAQSQIEAFATLLETNHAADINLALHGSVDLVAWANDAHQIARTDPYAKLKPSIASISTVSPVKTCADGSVSSRYFAMHEKVSAAYVQSIQADVEGQLSKAGGRLAAILYSTLK
jgi:hypothetical protein